MYRDGEIIAIYQLDATTGWSSLAGCANACLLDWRVDAVNQASDTDCSDTTVTCPTGLSTNITATRQCENFMFNIDTGVCYLLSAESYSRFTSSDNFWSGHLVCADITSIDDWAQGVVA